MYCHMGDFGCGGGGWTTVIKMDGNKVSCTKKDVIHFILFHFITPGLSGKLDDN